MRALAAGAEAVHAGFTPGPLRVHPGSAQAGSTKERWLPGEWVVVLTVVRIVVAVAAVVAAVAAAHEPMATREAGRRRMTLAAACPSVGFIVGDLLDGGEDVLDVEDAEALVPG